MSSREERIRDHGTTNDNKASRPPNKPPLNPTRTRAHSRTAFANLHAIIMGIGVAGNREDNVAEETTETEREDRIGGRELVDVGQREGREIEVEV